MTQLASLTLDRRGSLAIATIAGEVDLSNAEDLGTRILRSVSNEDEGVVLDLTGMTYCDSAGINLVFALDGRLREHGQSLRIVLPPDSQPSRTFAIVGVEEHVPIFPTLEQASPDTTIAAE